MADPTDAIGTLPPGCETAWRLTDWMPMGGVTMLVGAPRIGRTWLALQIACSAATNQKQAIPVEPGQTADEAMVWAGTGGTIAYYAAQDPLPVLQARAHHIAYVLKYPQPAAPQLTFLATTPPDPSLQLQVDSLCICDGHTEAQVRRVADVYEQLSGGQMAVPILWLPSSGKSEALTVRPQMTWTLSGSQKEGWALHRESPYVAYGALEGYRLIGSKNDAGRSWWDNALPPFWRLPT